jgi:hypothetical protein
MAHRTPPTARCRRTAFDELECTISFDAALIAAWKREVPYSRRSYDPDTKAWRFWGGYEDVAATLLLKHFPSADVPHRPRSQASARSQPTGSDHFRVLHLRESAPVELIEGAYRILARLHHPDAGGSHDAMQAINGAYAALRERVGA